MKNVCFSMALMAIFAACNSTETNNAKREDSAVVKKADGVPNVGADKDDHGCIASAGYQWSVLKNKCIRTFEEKDVQLLPVKDTLSYTSATAVVFNADKSKAELFMPNQKNSMVLERSGKEGSYVWKLDSLEMSANNGYSLKSNGKLIYQGK
jgi:hypothetical protein